jgi:hypothetical protein
MSTLMASVPPLFAPLVMLLCVVSCGEPFAVALGDVVVAAFAAFEVALCSFR